MAQPLLLGDLLERGAELSVIDSLLEQAREGGGRLLVIEGPAGIGKTRLAEEARARAEAMDMETLMARGSELERDLAFGIVRQLFEPLLASASDEQRSALLSGAARFAEPALSDELLEPGARQEDSSYTPIHGLYWLTANLTERRPLLVAVDDAHWADAASLRWLAYLIKRIDGLPALALVTSRTAEPGADDILDEITSDPLGRVLRPSRLSEAAVGELIRGSHLSEAEDEFCAACHSATQGNPFLLRELLNELAFEEVPPTGENVARVSQLGPTSISRVVLRRLARLPQEATPLVQAVAILHDDAELRHAAALAGLDVSQAAEAAEALARVEILRGEERLGFVHPVVRAAIHTDMGPARRAREHARAARMLREAVAPTDRVAHHLLVAEPSGEAWVVDTLRTTARAASARGAREEAVAYLRRALAEPPAAEARIEVLIELGWAEVHTRGSAGVQHLREALELTSDPIARGEIALQLGRALAMVADLHEAAAALDRAISEVGSTDRDLAIALETEFIGVALGDLSTSPLGRERLARIRDRLGPDLPDDPTLLASLAVAAASEGESREDASKLATRALDAYRVAGKEDSRVLALIGNALAWADELELAARLWGEALAEARRRGSPLLFATASTFRSNVAQRCGSLREAEADARAALEALDPAAWGFPAPIYALAFLIEALVERGELDAATATLDGAAIGEKLPELAPFNRFLYSRGRLRISQGLTREGTADLLECGRRLEGFGVRNPTAIPWRSTAALGLLALERRAEARRLAGEEVALARRFGSPSALGTALRAAGLVEEGEKGIEPLREAVSVLESSPAALELARAQIELGAALRRRGHRSDARGPLREGLHLAARCGAIPLTERAVDELVATGARPRRVPLSGLSALTASEYRVARMATEGQTNREIAQGLFITEKTVEMHLSNAYKKLGIGSRSQLAAVLRKGERPALLDELTARRTERRPGPRSR